MKRRTRWLIALLALLAAWVGGCKPPDQNTSLKEAGRSATATMSPRQKAQVSKQLAEVSTQRSSNVQLLKSAPWKSLDAFGRELWPVGRSDVLYAIWGPDSTLACISFAEGKAVEQWRCTLTGLGGSTSAGNGSLARYLAARGVSVADPSAKMSAAMNDSTALVIFKEIAPSGVTRVQVVQPSGALSQVEDYDWLKGAQQTYPYYPTTDVEARALGGSYAP